MQQHRKVQVTGVDTYQLPTLSNEKMRKLFKKAQQGNESAREELVCNNLRLVLSVLQRFKNRGEHIDDLFQVGCVGLLKAIDNFQLDQNVNFSTYAVPMIMGEIKRYLRDNNPIHISRSLKSMAQQVQQTKERLAKQNQKEPTVTEIANDMGVEVDEVLFAYNAAFDPVSLYDPVFNDSSDPVYVVDLLNDKNENSDVWVEGLELTQAMKELPTRERQILFARFFEGRTQTEIAAEIGISQAQVSRIEKAALSLIRRYYQGGTSGKPGRQE